MKLDLQSERYAPTGNISGSGVRKSLGTPTLDSLQILIRESAQNAWDARLTEASTVSFRVSIRVLTKPQHHALRTLLSALPAGAPTQSLLSRSLQQKSLSVIEISDAGTTGLGGPVRGDEEPSCGDHPDFADFFRNVGSVRDRHLGAGTYGYGKSAMYRLSRCGTVIAYTQTTCAGRNVTRLMAASIGEAYEDNGHRYTGRHWWGTRQRDSIVDPVTGADTHAIGESLGMARRGIRDRGTTILVLDPELEGRSHTQAANAVAECLAWFFWPKMIAAGSAEPSMIFEVAADDEPSCSLDVRSFPPLAILAEAMANAKKTGASTISCERPIQRLGRIGFARGPRLVRHTLDTGSEHPLIPDRISCVALMRPVELVVKYLPGPPLPSDMVEYAGVFICDEEVEAHFADAEPPAHDDWIPDFLEGRAKSFVRVALRKIGMAMEHYANPPLRDTPPVDQPSLALLGDALGNVLLDQLGPRLGGSDGGGSRTNHGNSNKHQLRISDPEPFRFAVVRRVPCAVFRIRISGNQSSKLKLVAKPLIVLEGGAIIAPEGPDAPRVVGWLDGTGHLASEGARIELARSVDVLHVAVSVREDAAITVTVENLSAD